MGNYIIPDNPMKALDRLHKHHRSQAKSLELGYDRKGCSQNYHDHLARLIRHTILLRMRAIPIGNRGLITDIYNHHIAYANVPYDSRSDVPPSRHSKWSGFLRELMNYDSVFSVDDSDDRLNRSNTDEPVKQGESKMKVNMLAAAMLIREDVVTVSVRLGSGLYTFVCDKKITEQLTTEANDEKHCMVLVETRKGFSVGKVQLIHADMEIDVDGDIDYRYVVSKVDIVDLEAKKLQDRKVAKHLMRHRQKSNRMSVLAALGVNNVAGFLEEVNEEPDDPDLLSNSGFTNTHRGSEEDLDELLDYVIKPKW